VTEHIIYTPELCNELVDFVHNDENTRVGQPFKWSKTHSKIGLRPNELTIVTGVNGHGKSMFLNDIMVNHLIQNKQGTPYGAEPWWVYSGEISTKRFLYRTIRQMLGQEQPPNERIVKAVEWLNGKLYLSRHVESVTYPSIVASIVDYYENYGCKYFLIDSFMKCGIREEDYQAQKLFLDALCNIKNSIPVHIFLVAHARKPPAQRHSQDKAQMEPPPMKEDIRGIGTITDMADNVWSVWRNKNKEFYPHLSPHEPDVKLFVLKQRNYEWEGEIGFTFRKDGCTYD